MTHKKKTLHDPCRGVGGGAGDPSHNLLYCCQHHARFQVYAEKYAEDEDAFFKDYAEAHAKLSNLGAKFNPPEVR